VGEWGISSPLRQDLVLMYYAEIQGIRQRLPDGLAGNLGRLVV
jgi:hypothetical protein